LIEAPDSHRSIKLFMNETLSNILSENITIRDIVTDGDCLLVEIIFGKSLSYLYLTVEKDLFERGNINLRDLMVFLPYPLMATIFTWFIPFFSREIEIYYYGDWTIFLEPSPSIYDVKRAISAIRIAISS